MSVIMDNPDNNESPSAYKKAGVMNEAQRKMRTSNIEAIKRNWNIEDFLDFFPDSIRPQSLGNSALSTLRSISNKVNESVAKTLFLNECQKPDGGYCIAGVTHAQRILKSLNANDNSPKPASAAKSKTKLGKKPSKKACDPDALDSSPRPAPKRASVDRFPTGRIPKKNSIGPNGPGFTPINKSMPASPNNAEQCVDLAYDNDDEDEPPSVMRYSNDFNHLKHNRGPKPGSSQFSLSYQTPSSEGENAGNLHQGQNESAPKCGKLDLSKGAPSKVLKNSERENQVIGRQSKPSDQRARNWLSPSPLPRRDNDRSVKNQTASLLTPKETLGGANSVQQNDDKAKETGGGIGEMDHDKEMAEIDRKMMVRQITREREAQKLRELTLGSTTISTAPVPFTYTPPVFPDAVARNVKAQSEGPVQTKRAFEDEEEIRDTIIVDISSQPPAKRRKADSAPLENTEFSSSPPVAPVAPMMGPVQSPLANKRSKASSVPFEDKYPSARLGQMNPTTKTETIITTPPENENPLSPEQKAPVAPMHTPTTPINDPPTPPTPTVPVEGTSTKKLKTSQSGTCLNKSKSKDAKRTRHALRAMNNEVAYIMTLGDSEGPRIMEDLAGLVERNAERFKAEVEALIRKHGLREGAKEEI